MSDALINRIATSGLITLKPEEWVPAVYPEAFDLSDVLFQGLILRELDFREKMKIHPWQVYQGKVLCVYCSADAIIPSWAYMLVATMAAPYAAEVFYGTPDQWIIRQILRHIEQMDTTSLADQRVIIKGCSDQVTISPDIYVALTSRLVPVVRSLMFGEPCSTVPVYKRPKSV